MSHSSSLRIYRIKSTYFPFYITVAHWKWKSRQRCWVLRAFLLLHIMSSPSSSFCSVTVSLAKSVCSETSLVVRIYRIISTYSPSHSMCVWAWHLYLDPSLCPVLFSDTIRHHETYHPRVIRNWSLDLQFRAKLSSELPIVTQKHSGERLI